jgi:hypothetical protein
MGLSVGYTQLYLKMPYTNLRGSIFKQKLHNILKTSPCDRNLGLMWTNGKINIESSVCIFTN